MKTLKRFAPLAVSLLLLSALGTLGVAMSANADRRAQEIHRRDRLTLQYTLAGLANQYFQFALKEAYDFANSTRWSLAPGDTTDRGLLRAFVDSSELLDHGAALATMSGEPLTVYAKGPGLPPPTDPGYVPLVSALLARRPGASSLMEVGDAHVVALAVPVQRGGMNRALLIAYMRAETSPLQTYSNRLRYGRTGHGYTIDAAGTVVTSSDASSIGHKLAAGPALAALGAGRRGFTEYTQDGVDLIASYSPIDFAGWSTVTVQEAGEFYGPIATSGRNVRLALIAFALAAVATLAVLNHKRQMALRRAYEYKGELLANTTHELKTPLTAIKGATMTLGPRWRSLRPEQVDQLLGIIHRRSDGLEKLIGRILMGARLEAGRELSVHPQPVEVEPLLRRIVAEFADVSPQHRMLAHTNLDPWVTADPDSLDQILGLLAENAVKYSPEGGEIRLEAVRQGGSVLFRVVDSGIGIAPEDVEHVFEPYFRASRGDRKPAGGVGLGLSITRHLLRRQGGEIHVASEHGLGTVFTFTLPACPPQHVEAPVSERVDR